MRIDKYLKIARILKRRPVAKELAENDRLLVNSKIAKAATEVEVGDIIEIRFGHRTITIKVLDIKEQASKQDALSMYEVLSEDKSEMV